MGQGNKTRKRYPSSGSTPQPEPRPRQPGERVTTPRQRQAEGRQRLRESQQQAKDEREQEARESQTGVELQAQIGPKTNVSQSASLRYPKSAKGGGSITEDSDYVLFEFYKYAPPFGKQRTDANFTERTVTTPRSSRNRRGQGSTQ